MLKSVLRKLYKQKRNMLTQTEKELINHSYELIVKGLTKKLQEELKSL